MTRPPLRLAWAIDRLAAREGERIAEIGAGNGRAIAILLQQASPSFVLGVDRSAIAIANARRLHAASIASGKVAMVHGELTAARPGMPMDRVFAVNVNAFWRVPHTCFEEVAQWLRPRGTLLLVFEAPTPGKADAIARTLSERDAYAPFSRNRHRKHPDASSLVALEFER
jgi:SAM-dependent methyltransferase